MDRKYTKVRKTGHEELDKVVWEWFTRARAKKKKISQSVEELSRSVH